MRIPVTLKENLLRWIAIKLESVLYRIMPCPPHYFTGAAQNIRGPSTFYLYSLMAGNRGRTKAACPL